MLKFDEYILAKFQKMCDKLQETVGISKFTLTKYLLIAGCLSFVVLYIISGDLILLGLSIFVSISAYNLIKLVNLEEEIFLKYGALLVPSFWNGKPWRIIYLVWMLIFSVTIFTHLLNFAVFINMLLVVAWMYVEGCVPKPPSKSKARKLYERLLTKLNDALEPSPDLAPTSGT